MKEEIQKIESAVKGRFTSPEREVIKVVRHGISGGFAVGAVLALYSVICQILGHKIELKFFNHLYSGIDPGFVFVGYALAALPLIFTGAAINGKLHAYLVEPWLSFNIHTFSWISGTAIPFTFLLLYEGQVQLAFTSVFLVVAGGLIAAFSSIILRASDPASHNERDEEKFLGFSQPARIAMGLLLLCVMTLWLVHYAATPTAESSKAASKETGRAQT